MPQNEYIEQHIKKHGRRLDYEERKERRKQEKDIELLKMLKL